MHVHTGLWELLQQLTKKQKKTKKSAFIWPITHYTLLYLRFLQNKRRQNTLKQIWAEVFIWCCDYQTDPILNTYICSLLCRWDWWPDTVTTQLLSGKPPEELCDMHFSLGLLAALEKLPSVTQAEDYQSFKQKTCACVNLQDLQIKNVLKSLSLSKSTREYAQLGLSFLEGNPVWREQ